jgi:hypothetical protein
LDADILSYGLIEEFIVMLDSGSSSTLKVYWLLHEKELYDGLRILASDEDTLVMRTMAKKGEELCSVL